MFPPHSVVLQHSCVFPLTCSQPHRYCDPRTFASVTRIAPKRAIARAHSRAQRLSNIARMNASQHTERSPTHNGSHDHFNVSHQTPPHADSHGVRFNDSRAPPHGDSHGARFNGSRAPPPHAADSSRSSNTVSGGVDRSPNPKSRQYANRRLAREHDECRLNPLASVAAQPVSFDVRFGVWLLLYLL